MKLRKPLSATVQRVDQELNNQLCTLVLKCLGLESAIEVKRN